MKVYFGPYRDNFNRNTVEQFLEKFCIVNRDREKIADWILETKLGSAISKWTYKHFTRTTYVKLDRWDTWNMDGTLSMIILPLLKQLKEEKMGSPFVDDDDVPEELRSYNAPPKENDWDTDDLWHKRFEWVLNEIIWTFEQIQPDYDWENQYWTGEGDWVFDKVDDEHPNLGSVMTHGPNHTLECDWDARKKHQEKIDNGLRLFGKYYQAFWN